MFGRKKKTDVDEEPTSFFGDENDESVEIDEVEDDLDVAGDEFGDESEGPYDITEIDSDDPTAGRDGQRLDLGSVLVPMPTGGQLQVEMAPNGSPQAVHLVTEHGRITVAAYAAPKSPGQWREVVAELAQSLRDDNSAVSVENGPWGRELAAVTANMDLRFIGVDGPRWMVRCVVAGPSGSTAANTPLVAIARDILRDTVVNRGSEPHPVRTPLPVVLPQVLAEQLAAAHEQQLATAQQQQVAAQQQQQSAPPAPPAPPARPTPPPRSGESGSAMQQLGQ
ncbi:DUF3710 domain-containing protein [Rhodococcus erythropolis]|jgi:uncharacterized protein YggU (UPF0235/DUF167 family)|uniref:DUF3710 domain-containing protein n=1 Tax=Rhodococcus erythropolis TaxID=1833 RepID=A0A1F2Q5U6_RHOER|nr:MULTISPECIES: DUF3710 domain-containing protein [Rhodococcus]MBH5147861.1 DUF3710 domain-containing protein [Rhodococcus erythropolis]MCW2301188.1 uncharacterized protein YggU (UPF0235/DUF167 family) [Rhodococcus erythropolis]MCZ4566594.1 DUF3710 domain-containing protein [Rhodococcus erythropolis]MDN3459718.1 DUF3710 domain-containing protein [Rhodococcus sp. APC 3903]MDV8014009.1 DUF3710 domain-containing protein [Rhodococcus sp. IEGM 1241]